MRAMHTHFQRVCWKAVFESPSGHRFRWNSTNMAVMLAGGLVAGHVVLGRRSRAGQGGVPTMMA